MLLPPAMTILITVSHNIILMLLFIFAEQTLVYMEIKRSITRMLQAEKTAGIGYYEWDPTTCKHTWTNGFYHILGLPVLQEPPSSADFMQMVHTDDRETAEKQN